jgi:hypothetical protein
MNRTIKEATIKRYHYDSHALLTAHLHDFIDACNYGRCGETLKGLPPPERVEGRIYLQNMDNRTGQITLNPTHQMTLLNTWC